MRAPLPGPLQQGTETCPGERRSQPDVGALVRALRKCGGGEANAFPSSAVRLGRDPGIRSVQGQTQHFSPVACEVQAFHFHGSPISSPSALIASVDSTTVKRLPETFIELVYSAGFSPCLLLFCAVCSVIIDRLGSTVRFNTKSMVPTI